MFPAVLRVSYSGLVLGKPDVNKARVVRDGKPELPDDLLNTAIMTDSGLGAISWRRIGKNLLVGAIEAPKLEDPHHTMKSYFYINLPEAIRAIEENDVNTRCRYVEPTSLNKTRDFSMRTKNIEELLADARTKLKTDEF